MGSILAAHNNSTTHIFCMTSQSWFGMQKASVHVVPEDISALAETLDTLNNESFSLKHTTVTPPRVCYGDTEALREECMWPQQALVTKDTVFEEGLFSLKEDKQRTMCVVSCCGVTLRHGTLQLADAVSDGQKSSALVFDGSCRDVHLSNLKIVGTMLHEYLSMQ